MKLGRSVSVIAVCFVATAVLLGVDLWTKTWAEENLSRARTGELPELCHVDDRGYRPYQRLRNEGMTVVEGFFEFDYAENCGAAFSMLDQAPAVVRHGIFGVAAVAATIAFAFMLVTGRGGTLFPVAVPLIVSGALGNLVDRVRYGYVVDFIHWHWRDSFDYPTFNFADVTIAIGVVLLVIDSFRTEDAAKEAEAAKLAVTDHVKSSDAPDTEAKTSAEA